MTENRDKITWEELNQRSRWYTAQLWYVPFAYVGIVGFAFDKIVNLPYPLNSFGLFLLGIFSIAVFVHVLALKFYERRAVSSMQEQELEGSRTISGGGSQWYLSFTWYIKVMICFASYLFTGWGLWLVEATTTWQKALLWIPLLPLTILYCVIFWQDHVRNRKLVEEIRQRTYPKKS